MGMVKKVKCSLCQMEMLCDEQLHERIARHTPFHQNAWRDKRNTTQGTPKYEPVYDNEECEDLEVWEQKN